MTLSFVKWLWPTLRIPSSVSALLANGTVHRLGGSGYYRTMSGWESLSNPLVDSFYFHAWYGKNVNSSHLLTLFCTRIFYVCSQYSYIYTVIRRRVCSTTKYCTTGSTCIEYAFFLDYRFVCMRTCGSSLSLSLCLSLDRDYVATCRFIFDLVLCVITNTD